MALVHKGFSTYGPSAAYVTAARLIAGFTEVARRLSERRWLTLTNDFRDCEHCSGWRTQTPGRPPGACSMRDIRANCISRL
jgi:hypothetical protein